MGRRRGSLPPAPMNLSSAEPAQIDHDRQNQKQQVDPLQRKAGIDQPGVNDRRYWQEDEAKNRQQQVMVSALKIGREQEHQHQNDPREQEQHKY